MLITLPLILVSLLITYLLFRKFKVFTIISFITLPVMLSPLWYSFGYFEWFRWVKIYSLVAIILFIYLTRFEGFHENKKIINFIYFLLSLNIFEAVVKDLNNMDLSSVFNIIVGLLLILFLWLPTYDRSRGTPLDFLSSKLTLPWIVTYTIWNWLFVYSEYIEFSLKHIFVLSVPIIINFFIKNTWLQARAITLGSYIIFSFSTNPYLEGYFPVTTYNDSLALTLSTINLIFFIFYLAIYSSNKEVIVKNTFLKRHKLILNFLLHLIKR